MGQGAPPSEWSQWGALRLLGAGISQTARMPLADHAEEWYHAVCNRHMGGAGMPRHSDSTTKATGRDLISQAQDAWGEVRDTIPPQQRSDLGQVLTELGSRINYTCTGQPAESKSKYSTLGGSELASHAQKMIQRVSGQLPVSASRSLTLVIGEMANRVRYAAEGEPQTQTGGNGEGFDFSEGMKQSQHQHTFA